NRDLQEAAMRSSYSHHPIYLPKALRAVALTAAVSAAAMFTSAAAMAHPEGDSFGGSASENDIYVVQREGECLLGVRCDNGSVQCPSGGYATEVLADGTGNCATGQTRRVTP